MSDKAGIERDREIAEIRGERCMHYYPIAKDMGVGGPSCLQDCISFPECCNSEENNPRCFCRAYEYRPYSTSIVHAMELWDEMKREGMLNMTTFMEAVEVAFYISDEEGKNKEKYKCFGDATGNSETEADAISGCWLKWKEQS